MLALLYERDALHVALDAPLSLLAKIVAYTTDMVGLALLLDTSCFVVAHGLLAERVHDLALLVSVALCPGFDELEHLTLDL